MIDNWTGHWYEEKDYMNYPKEKMCFYDYMAIEIRKVVDNTGYKIKTDMEHLIDMILDDAEENVYLGYTEIDLDNPYDIIQWAMENDWFENFDYHG